MLADVVVVLVLGGLLLWSHRGAFVNWVRSATLPIAEVRAARLSIVLTFFTVMSLLSWAKFLFQLGPERAAKQVVNDIPAFEENRCFNAQRFGLVPVRMMLSEPVENYGQHCPVGGGPYEVNGGELSCPVHGKAPP